MTPVGCTVIGCGCSYPFVHAKEPDPRLGTSQADARREAAIQDLHRALSKSAQTQPVMTAHDTATLRAAASDESLSEFVRLAVYEVLVRHLAPAGGR